MVRRLASMRSSDSFASVSSNATTVKARVRTASGFTSMSSHTREPRGSVDIDDPAFDEEELEEDEGEQEEEEEEEPMPRPHRKNKERRTSSGDSTSSCMSITSTPGYRLRPVSISDEDLVALAHATKRKIQWDTILRSRDVGPTRWKWQEHIGDFSIFVREDTQRYSVLAIGVVPGSVAELVSVMHARDNDHYLRKMEAIYGDHFKDGCFVYNVDLESSDAQEFSRTTADPDDDSVLVGLSVKTATFQKPNWLASHEEWCYLDAVYQQPRSDDAAPSARDDIFEKLMTSIRPQDIIAGLSAKKTKYIESVVSGYLLEPEHGSDNSSHDGRRKMTRVHFYSELSKTTNQHHFGGLYMPSLGTTAVDKAVKNRLLKMARSCARFPLIIRRRRLGVQNIVDLSKVFPPTKTRCIHCEKFLLIAKLCRLCGQGVCQGCSKKHYRETVEGSKARVHHIRVCDSCIERVDRSNYSYLTHTCLAPPQIVKDQGLKRASSVLKTLLKDAFLTAESAEKKASVLSVIKCVLDQEGTARESSPFSIMPPAHCTSPGVVVTTGISDKEVLDALAFVDASWSSPSPEEQPLAHAEGRGYAVDSRRPHEQLAYPTPPNEEQRIRAIETELLREMGNIEELNIVCELAAFEIGCFAALVTVVDRDVQFMLGANRPDLRDARFPRAHTFCSHIIMDTKPLVIPHPEADIRFHQCAPVLEMNARFYCGFPLLARDGTVLGSLCCVDHNTHELTGSQFIALRKLAQTAAKVVRKVTDQLRDEKRRREEHIRKRTMSARSASSSGRHTSHPSPSILEG